MQYTHFFQWNVPADNEFTGSTNSYVNVLATWDGKTFYNSDGRPMVSIRPVNFTFYDCLIVKNWHIAQRQIENAAEKHFAEIAKAERIAQARATLVSEGELTGNPILDRYTEAEKDLQLQQHLS